MQLIETDILRIVDGEYKANHRLIAKFAGIEEKSVLDIINRNKNDIEDFGVLRFKIAKPPRSSTGGKPTKTYHLNRDQALFLMTLLRNTPTIKAFKKALIKEFSLMQEFIINSLTYNKDGKRISNVLGAYKAQSKHAWKKLSNFKEKVEQSRQIASFHHDEWEFHSRRHKRVEENYNKLKEEHENLKSQIKDTFGEICQTN